MSIYQSIVITGGKGMLAQAIEKTLRERNLTCNAVGREVCDITSESDVRRLFADRKPTLLVNCAAHTKVDLCEDEREKANAINGRAVRTLSSLARENGCFLVHYSTDFVFDGSGRRPCHPDDPVNPLSAYGRSKLLGERKLQENAPAQWLILRTAWLYGRGGPNFPRTIVERARQGQPLKVVNDQIGSPTHTIDLAQATLDLLDRQLTGIWHLTNSGSTSWYDFARAALEEFDLAAASLAPLTTAEWLAIRPKQAHRPSYSVLDVEPFARATGRPMRPWREGLRDFRRAVAQAGEAW
jgi:dTDP-4-dehydrorhamnose reductase